MRVVPVPCLRDNYAYLLASSSSRTAVVIDPSEASPVLDALHRENLDLVAIVNTHHHFDHVGGNEELCERFGGLPVYAHDSDFGRVPRQSERVSEGQPVTISGVELRPLHVPGHTSGAVAYVVEDAVFTGDTLFVAGCGRLFEGTAAQMLASLEKLASLPPQTRVYCGHEYTLKNLEFAASVEPDNDAVAAKLHWARKAQARGELTVPSTIADELLTNPFLRCRQPSVQARFPGGSAAEVFAAVRQAKDAA